MDVSNEHKEDIFAPKNVNLMTFFPKILNVPKENFQMKPSEFNREMTLKLEERHKRLITLSCRTKPLVSHYPPQFKIIPNIIVFQRFDILAPNHLTLEIRNLGKASIGLKMQCPESIYFSASFSGKPLSKLAPGLSVTYKVTFTPQEPQDYKHHLLFITENLTFKVPIVAIGPRPLLDIPDSIVLSPAPVKIATSKYIVVRNIGDTIAVFNFSVGSKYFELSPAKGIIGAHGSMLLCIKFQSNKVQEINENLYLMYETGEKLIITLHGSAENISVRLDKNSVVHDDTYIGLRKCKIVRVINNSSSVIKFSWKKNPKSEDDHKIIRSMEQKYKEMTELEILKDARVQYFGLSNHENHKLSCERILNDELKLLQKEDFKFTNDFFTLMPESGEVWPKDSKEVIVSFLPKTCDTVQAVAFLEASGRDTRLPLKIKGTGLGPKISLNVKMLDIDFIYLCSQHQYEVIAENKGDIPGTVCYVQEPLVFGGKMDVTPPSRFLKPDEVGVFVLSFTSNRPGEFTEKLTFLIKESKKTLCLAFKGKIVSPTLHFDKKEINFGSVPFGISVTREATLNNLSVVPVTFSLRVSPDGDAHSVSYDEFAKFTTKPSIPQFPKEFDVDPEESVVEPYSKKKVTVTVTANKVGSFQKQLVVDMWDSENGSVSCPINYRVEVANLVGDPDMIIIPFCFINYPYTRSITLKNLSHVAGLFYIVPLNPNSERPVTYSASVLQGVIPPHRSFKIDVTVIISSVGRQVFPISMVTFGSDLPQEVCTISCLGQGPIINIEPNNLNWGQVPLLISSEKTLNVTNVSPIPANLDLSLAKQSNHWSVTPSHLMILPEEVAKVTVSLTLNECGKFKELLKINIFNGKDLTVTLTAVGVGSSLLVSPTISPVYDLGTLFCHKKYEFQVSLENKGTKSYGLLWSPYVEYKTFVNAKFSLPEDSVFRIEPIKMDILPGETKYMAVEAHSKSLGFFTQTFYCFANSGSPTKKLHYTSEICAKFVGPTITFDKEEINFWHYTGADGVEEKLYDSVSLKNMSVLPVQIQVSTSSPFCLITESSTCVNSLRMGMDGFEKKQLNLKFLAPQNLKKYFKVYSGKLLVTMNDTSKTSSLVLKGEVSYPNISIKPVKVDFRHVKVGTNACIEVNILNTSPLTVYYNLKWKKQMCQLVHLEKQSSATALGAAGELRAKERMEEFEENAPPQPELEPPKTEREPAPTASPLTPAMNPPKKPVVKMPNIEISNSDVKALLFNLTRNYYNCDNELLDVYKMVRSTDDVEDSTVAMCNKYCVITPFYGKLEPYCSQVLYVGFSSDKPVKLHLEALIQIRAGPTELLTIDAISGDIDYRLSATELDFGKQLFCETLSQVLKIRNTSDMPFNYETYIGGEDCGENEYFSLGQGVVTISPSSGSLSSFQTAELIVRYHPGVPGKFETVFRLRIGHLSPIVIKVRGIGVFPQMYVFLPRPEILKLPPEIGYWAVASITPDWIMTEYSTTGSWIYDLNQLKPYRSREDSLCDLLDLDMSGENWEVIKSQEFLPSEIDIYLAIERIIAYDLIAEDRNNSSFAVYARTIPRFVVPGYELDFGVCVIGRIVERQVTIMNFGPLPAVFYGIFGLNLKEEGIHVRLKNRNELKVGSCLPFTVAFYPKRGKYKKKYEAVKSIFFFEIYHGPKIPIKISAEVTYPHVQPSIYLLNFREVICGQCKVINLTLKNPGLVKAKWTLVVKNETIHAGSVSEPSTLSSMFNLNVNTGVLNPSEFCTVLVSFKPALGQSFSATLHVQVTKSLETLKIQLLGTGIEPKLALSHTSLNFSSALPFPVKEEAFFSVENPSAFPIEFFFPEFDEEIEEEEKIINAMALYYQTDELLLPVRRPGEGLPQEIIDFYNILLEGLNTTFMEKEREKLLAERGNMEENSTSAILIEEDGLSSPVQENAPDNFNRKKKKFRKRSRSGTSLDTSRDLLHPKEPTVPTIFEAKTAREIEEMLQDYIKTNFVGQAVYDPVQAAMRNILAPVVEEEHKEGALIICHGAPFTNSVLLANRLAISVNITALSIDRIVLTEAALGRCQAGVAARELIEQTYWEFFDVEKKELGQFDEWGESPLPSEELSFDGNLEEIQRKYKALVDLRESGGRAKGGIPSTAKSEASKKDKSGSPVKTQANVIPNPILSEDMVFEVLKYRLDLEVLNGLVIESLESTIIGPPTKVLTLLLKAAGNIKDIIVVFFLGNYSNFILNVSVKLSEEELAKSYLREEILNVLEEESETAFKSLNLNAQDEDVFRSFFLTKRHEAYQQFLKKRETFYGPKNNEESQKKEEQASPVFVGNTPQVVFLDKKGKDSGKKKETTSEPSARKEKDKEESELGRVRRESAEKEFWSFEMEFAEMKEIIENWDQRLGAVVPESTVEFRTKKGQTPRRVESAALSKSDDSSKRGVFLWLLDVSYPRSKIFQACCNYLKEVFRSRQKETKKLPIPTESEDGMLFSVVYSTPKKIRNPPQRIFLLSAVSNNLMVGEDYEVTDYTSSTVVSTAKLNRSVSSISFKSKKKSTAQSRRGKVESRMSTDIKGVRKTSTNSTSDEAHQKYRFVLEPGEKQVFRVRFYPTEMGRWEHQYVIQMVSWRNGDVVHCSGECDIPRINMKPEVLFSAVEHFRPLTSRFFPAFYYSLNAYDYGAIITSPSSDKVLTEKTAILNLCNISTLPVDLTVVLADDETSDEDSSASHYIKFSPDKMLIQPKESKQLIVTACPMKYGPVSEAVLLIIKNNPLVQKITMMFEGVKANVSVSPKVVNFERQLLQRKELRNMVFTNDNTIELYAALKFPENFPPQFSFSHKTICLPPLGSANVEVNYNAVEVQTVHEKPVLVQIFDSLNAVDPVQELTFYINAEAYDAALDISFSKPDEDHIDFGDIRVDNYYNTEFYLKNVGKYLLGYKIDIDMKLFSESEHDHFQVTPKLGKLLPGKIFPVTVTIMIQDEVSWKQIPFLKITLVEPFYGDEVIATIPISISARTHFTRYEIKPSSHLSFGHVLVGESVTGSLLIENKGVFSLSYFVDFQSSDPDASPMSSKKSSKISALDKAEKTKKSGSMAFKAGIFEISPGSGTVETKQTVVIKVTSTPQEEKNYEENIVIYVDESLPQLKNGNPITISAQACLPKIKFSDFRTLFREHNICKDDSELNSRIKQGTYTVFTENNNTFSFKNVCVNTKAEARIHLENAGLVDCKVTTLVRPSTDEENKKMVPEGATRFSISPERLVIEPYNSAILILSFRPDTLEVFRAEVVVKIYMPAGYDDNVWVFKVLGSGIFPQIEITEPKTKLPEGQTLVNFPPTSPGRMSISSIAFENTGILDCKVIMELYKFQEGVFSLLPKSGSEKTLKIWDLTKPIEHTAVVSLSPGQVVEFSVFFSPKEVQSYSSQIKLFIVDNPFENWCFKLTGDVFIEEIVIEKIRMTMPFLTESEPPDKATVPTTPGQYFINLGDCYVNNKSKVLMRLTNQTEKDYFKFEWEEIQGITLSPNVGHLYPNSYKEILLVFLPEEPLELDDVSIACRLNKIILENPSDNSWDSRLIQYHKQPKPEVTVSARSNDKMSVSRQPILETVKATGEEPKHEVIPETNKSIYVNLTAIADYTRLLCPTSKIFFKSTFMFQTRMYPLILENTGNITLEYKICLKTVTVWPLKENKGSQVTERSLLRKFSLKNRPLSSIPNVKSDGVFNPCDKRHRPNTTVSFSTAHKEHIDDCEQEPVQIAEEADKPYFNPFTIENAAGRIPPKEKISCNIVFSPMDMNLFKAVITILVPNLHPDCNLTEIEVSASSVMPYCHFDVPESDYLESGRRDFSRPGPVGFAPGVPLNPETKTIEVKVVGIGTTIPIKFHVINPTEEDYSFSWVNTTQAQPGVVPSFHCSTTGGIIRAGRQQLMVFNFKSQKVGITESFWKFSIPEHGIDTPFLLVGDAREPTIYFLSYYLTLKPTVIGSSSYDDLTLVNNEEISFEFQFVQESLFSEGRQNALKVEPMYGKVAPNSETTIRVTYTGRTSGRAVFKLKCKVKTIKEPFFISVEATTYLVQPLIAFEDLNKVKHFPEINKENEIDFGTELNPTTPETITLNFTCLSKTAFNYEWEYDIRILDAKYCNLTISPKCGHVSSKGKCDLTIVFSRKSALVNFPARLRIQRGPTFHFLINASATTPVCELSFSFYDFGYRFLQLKDVCYNETPLIVKNKSDSHLCLECVLPENSAFSFVFEEAAIPPKSEIAILIRFHPKECISYESKFKITFNSNYERTVLLKGHGTEFKMALTDPDDLTISLGAIRVGRSSTRQFSLINESLATATLLVGFSDQLPVNGVYFLKPEKHHLDLSKDHRLTGLLTISPSTVFRIKPQEVVTLSVTYTPVGKSPPFSETVSFQCYDRTEPLCVLTGCCLAPDIALDRKALNFGAVVKNCKSILKLKLVNSGSIGASFKWNVERLGDYHISPAQGYCSPESAVTIKVMFHPRRIQTCIKKRAICEIHLPENEEHPPLTLELIGDCVSLPEPKETLLFECNVRHIDSKELEIENPSGTDWQLLPVISGEYFKGEDVLLVPALTTAKYQVEYCPLLMSHEHFHKGSIFFEIPSGHGILYQLQGVSNPPNAQEEIKREVPCKTKYVELLKIKNWLQYPQRFRTKITCLENEGNPTFSCTGLEYVEVPAMGLKDYSLNFFSYNTGNFTFEVHFINEETKEYVWYKIVFKVHNCGPLKLIAIRSVVRQVCQHLLPLENPLDVPITYELKTTCPYLRFDSSVYEVPPKENVYATVSFLPIHAGETIESITAISPELGLFPWDLRLVGIEIQPGPPRTFETSLGTSVVQDFEIKNFASVNTVFYCKVDSDDFDVNENVAVAAGESKNVRVTYEPSEIGSTTATLSSYSEQAGIFRFPLLGFCSKPLAKGPFILRPGSGVNVPFKNVFKAPKEFHMSVDNPAFVLKIAQETLLPKEDVKIFVGLKKMKRLEELPQYSDVEINLKFPIMGQLIVDCFNPYIKWQFYLKGVLEK